MLVLGISAFYHEATCCLLRGGVIVAAASEERFSRIKHDPALPVEAFRWCLAEAGADVSDLDAVAYYEEPVAKLSRQIWSGRAAGDPARLDPLGPERAVRERLGWDGVFLTFPHHLSHAASAYFLSGFEDAAVLTADGVGEWATTGYGRGSGDEVELFATVDFPHSLGLLYSTLTSWLGFRVNSGEYKVMGLAPYGRPRYLDRLRRLVRSGLGSGLGSGPGSGPGSGLAPAFELDLAYFDFVSGRSMYSPALSELLGAPPRERGAEIDPVHCDVAASLQRLLEEILLEKVAWLAGEVPSENLCLAGGVALNCVANGRIRREGPFRRLFVQPAAGDAGGAVGAALLAHRRLAGGGSADGRPEVGRPGPSLVDVRLGPAWRSEAVAGMLGAAELPHRDLRGREEELLDAVAERLAGGAVVGWFQGRMELGPRALGARSILADPRDPGMRDRVNARVKKREGFRPFAPAVLADRAAEHFRLADRPGEGEAVRPLGPLEGGDPRRFMLETCPVGSPLDLPAVTHVDGSARPQLVDPEVDPRFAGLLAAFERRTGCPILLNTSFNVAGEPIVASPGDALLTFAAAGLDLLVLGDHLVDRSALPADAAQRVAVWRSDRHRPRPRDARSPEDGRAIPGDLYTFV